jgi:hypothetical protein
VWTVYIISKGRIIIKGGVCETVSRRERGGAGGRGNSDNPEGTKNGSGLVGEAIQGLPHSAPHLSLSLYVSMSVLYLISCTNKCIFCYFRGRFLSSSRPGMTTTPRRTSPVSVSSHSLRRTLWEPGLPLPGRVTRELPPRPRGNGIVCTPEQHKSSATRDVRGYPRG